MGDLISQLPLDNTSPSQEDMEILKLISDTQTPTLSESVKSLEKFISTPTIYSDIKDIVIITTLFVLFSSETFDNIISKLLPSMNKWYLKLIIKIILLVALYFVLVNLSVIKK